jgi:hypothetical protein
MMSQSIVVKFTVVSPAVFRTGAWSALSVLLKPRKIARCRSPLYPDEGAELKAIRL